MPTLAVAIERWPHIVDPSLYWRQISAYRRYYGDDRILVLFFEDLAERSAEVIRRCCDFLGVNPELVESGIHARHVSAEKRIDGPLVRRLQRLPMVRKLNSLSPRLSRAILPRLRRPLPRRPEWPADLRREVSARLKDDTGRFLEFYGRPDFWRLE